MPIDKARLIEAFPPHAVEHRDGGRGQSFAYVGHDTVTRRLIDATENTFDVSVDNVWFRTDGATRPNKSGEPTLTMVAQVTVTIPGLGSRTDIGVQNIQAGGGEDQYKGAISDAFKRAAMRFGVALELYGPDLEAGEVAGPPRTQRAAPGSPQRPPMAQDTAPVSSVRQGSSQGSTGAISDDVEAAVSGATPTNIATLAQERFDLSPAERDWLDKIGKARTTGTLDSIEAAIKRMPKPSQMLFDAIQIRKDEFFSGLTA